MTLIRVFVSVPVPDTPKMATLRSDLRTIDGIRVSPPEQTHITLRFIGDVDDSKVKRITESVRRAVEGVEPFEVVVSGTGAFPNDRRPSVVWMGLQPADVLAGIAERLGRELDSCNVRYDTKPFKAHVTVGRCRDGARMPGFFESHDGEFCRFTCSEVLVMRSELGPKGARHTVLERVPL